MNQKSKVSIGTARKVIEHHFHEKPKSIKQLHGGLANFVYEARLKNREVVLRMSDEPEKLECYLKEKWTIETAAKKKIPTPKVLEVGNEATHFPYMILEKISGEPADFHPKRIEILREMGRYAARINAIATSSFGHVYDWSPDKNSPKMTWKNYLHQELNLEHRIAFFERHKILGPKELRRFKHQFKEIERWNRKPTLSHGDIRLKNIVVNRAGKIQAILDWENSTSNCAPFWELSLALHDLAIDEKEAFLEGYGLGPKEYSKIAPSIRALNILNYYPVVEKAIKEKDKKGLDRLKLRLSGHLDLYSL